MSGTNRQQRRKLKLGSGIQSTSIVPDVDYAVIMSHALEGVVRTILEKVRDAQSEEGSRQKITKSDHALQIRVRIDREDVIIPPFIRDHATKNNIKMFDFILDRWFRHLEVREHDFSVDIMFGDGLWQNVTIPYASIVNIKEEAVGFNLNLEPHF